MINVGNYGEITYPLRVVRKSLSRVAHVKGIFANLIRATVLTKIVANQLRPKLKSFRPETVYNTGKNESTKPISV